MYLAELIVINYRSCRSLQVTFESDVPNILIGINDCGKSTILQAIGLLLEAKPKFNYVTESKFRDDLSNTRISLIEYESIFLAHDLPILEYNSDQCVVIGRFVIEGSDINERNQDTLSNQLLWVTEKSMASDLWLARCFNAATQRHVDLLLTPDAADEPRQYYSASQAALNKARKELTVTDEEIENENQLGRYKNIEVARAIYAKLSLAHRWATYRVDNDFWPSFRYLDWNITMDELNQFVADAVKTKIETPLALTTQFAGEQANEAQEILNQELEALSQIATVDLPHITRLKANITFQVDTKVTDIFINKLNADGDIHLESQGDGIKRQLWFALIRWSAETSVEQGLTDTRFIWAFDEPETHLYPKAQRDFFEIIKRVAQTSVQAILSTHSTIFVDRARFGSIMKVDLDDGYTSHTTCQSVQDIYDSLQLRNSDFLFYDKFLVVEGDTEQAVVPHLYRLHTGSTLLDDSIQLINLGGKDKCAHNQRILKALLQGFKKDVDSAIVYIFDRDVEHTFTPAEISDMCHCHFVGRQDLEDSICSSVWYELVTSQLNGCVEISLDEIEAIKSEIPEADPRDGIHSRLARNQKFYPRLQAHIRRRLAEKGIDPHTIDGRFPSKGLESGRLIAQYIDDIALVDSEIVKAFDALTG